MNLKRRDCPVKMRLVPYGAGWTDVYADFGDGELYFIISSVLGDSFETFMRALYHLHPNNGDVEEEEELIDWKFGICEKMNDTYVVTQIVDELQGIAAPFIAQDIPWKASFTWDEEGAESKWTLERAPDLNESFMLHITIDVCRYETKHYEYDVRYEDLCYAVADACTKALKKHGFWGYHSATYTADMNIRYLLFLKSIALGNMEARELTRYKESGKGETSDFEKEVELLLFDM